MSQAAPRGSGKQPVQTPEPEEEIDSLQQILEPDRTGVKERPGQSNKAVMVMAIIAVVLLMVVGGVLFFFKDRLFT